MRYHQDNVTDEKGNAIAGAQVLILKNGVNATIYSDNGITPAANPMQTDSNGVFAFYAASGKYSIEVTSQLIPAPIFIPEIILFDPDDVNETIRDDLASTGTGKGAEMVAIDIGASDVSNVSEVVNALVSGHGVIVDIYPGANVNAKTQAAVDALEDGGTVVFTRTSAPLLTAAPTVGTKVVNFVFPSGHAPSVDMPGMSQEVNLLDIPDSRYVSDEIRSDDVDAQANGGAFVNGYKCVMYPTANAKGGRQAIVGQVIMNETTPTDNANKRWIGVVGHARATVSQGGTGTGPGTSVGSLFGMNPYVYIGPNATNIRHITGGEVNTYMDTGSSCWFKAGWSIGSLDKEHATIDVGLNIAAAGDAVGFKTGVYFGTTNGGRAIGATGTFFQAENYTVAGSLLDFPGITFGGNIIKTDAFKVDGSGTTTIGTGAGAVELAFRTDATAATVDSRILASGGTAGAYGGTLQYQAANHVFLGAMRPSSDNSVNMGAQAFRFGATYSREFRPGSGAPIWTSGAGTPEGAVAAPVGSLYTRTDGGASTTLYIKESGAGNTGWVAK